MGDAFDEQVQPIRCERETAARELLDDYIDASDELAARFVFAALQRSYAYLDSEQRDRLTSEAIEALRGDRRAQQRLARLALLPD